jgi:hypothetical protein
VSLAAPRCAVCGRFFSPDIRSGCHQRYCRAKCARQVKRQRDREYQRHERHTPEGQVAKYVENRATRARLEWSAYMRFWWKADAERAARIQRAAAARYYQWHREEILRRKRQRRLRTKAAGKACPH